MTDRTLKGERSSGPDKGVKKETDVEEGKG